MGKVWQHDPFKAKWAVIAKAYSVLRDSLGKENAPLDKFFAISCSLMSIIEPAHYFVAMGWEIIIAEDGEPFMHRNERPIDPILFIDIYSVNDVICHCYFQGYFTRELTEVLLPMNEAEMSMAATMQPTSSDTNPLPVVAETFDDSAADITSHLDIETPANEDGALGMPDFAESVTDETDPTFGAHVVTQEDAHETDDNEVELTTGNTQQSVVTSHIPFELTMIDAIVGPAVNPSKGDAVEFQNAHYDLEGEYPFNEEFDPTKQATVCFDPFVGNQFDPFEVSEWNEFVDFDQYP